MKRLLEEKQARLDELEAQLEQERANHSEVEAELSDLKQKSEKSFLAASKIEFPEAATILSQFRAKRKKSPVSFADIEAILEIIEES